MYTDITPPCIRRAREVYTAVTRPCTGRPRPCRRPLCGRLHGRVTCRVHGRVTCRVHGRVTRRVPVTRPPGTRPSNTSSPAKTARTRLYNGRAVYTAVYGPCTRPVYTTRVHDCMDVFGRVHGAYTAPYTGRVHGHVRAVHMAVYTTRIRPRTRVYVSTCTRVVYTAVYRPSIRPKTAISTAVHGCVTSRVYGRVRAVTRPCTRAVWAVYTAGRPPGP